MKNKPFYTTRAFYISIVMLSIIALVIAFQAVTVRIKTDKELLFTSAETPASKWAINTAQYNILKTKFNLPDVAPHETTVTGTITQSTDASATTTATTTTAATTTPPPTKVVATITNLTIAVKNGTGIDGLAGTVKKPLADAGVANITVGNTKSPQKSNALYVKDTVNDAQLAKIKALLPASFTDTTREPALEGSTYDIEVIIGTPLE